MSLEAAIEANTAAVRELVTVWSKLASMGKTIATKVEAGAQSSVTAGNIEIPLEKPAAKKPAATPAVVEQVATTEPIAEATTATASPSEITSYEAVGAAITQAVKTRREDVVAALAKFGAKKGTELKAEQYADFLKALG
jgi:hypothetical protein